MGLELEVDMAKRNYNKAMNKSRARDIVEKNKYGRDQFSEQNKCQFLDLYELIKNDDLWWGKEDNREHIDLETIGLNQGMTYWECLTNLHTKEVKLRRDYFDLCK